jgi:uncharacterized protein YjbI with pentapeptide repeats
VHTICITKATIRNLTLSRCHVASAVFRDCIIENCSFDASVSTTALTVAACRMSHFQVGSHCAEVSFSDSDICDCNLRGGKEVKIDGCTLTNVEFVRDTNDCAEWTLEVSKSKVTSSMEIPASNTVLNDVSFSSGCKLIGGRDVKLKYCMLADVQFSCGASWGDSWCKLEISESVVATPIELPARASILLDDVIFLDGAWFNCDCARITRWSQVRIDGPVKLEDVTFNDRVEGTCFSAGSAFKNCNFEFGMGNVAAVECTFNNCKMDSAMKNYHLAHCNFVGSCFDGCAFLPNYPSRGTTLYEAQEVNNFSFAEFKQCTLMGRTSSFKFTDPQLSAAWNLHEAKLL